MTPATTIDLGEPGRCRACGRPGMLTARIPHGWTTGSGKTVNGNYPVTLCETCDAHQPEAGALITFLHVHELIDDTNMHEFATLTDAWAATLKPPELDQAAFDADYDAWRAGELDS